MSIVQVKALDVSGRVMWEGSVSSTLLAVFRDAMRTLDYITTEVTCIPN